MSNFKIGQLYDSAFAGMSPEEVSGNLDAIAWGVTEKPYTRNLSPEELAKKKDAFAEAGLVLADLEAEKKLFMDDFKLREKEPKELQKELMNAIRFKSEQKQGRLYLIDDQEEGIMYFFDKSGTCVEARQLEKSERQTKLKTINSHDE